MSGNGLSVWFQEDISQALQAAHIANQRAIEAAGLTMPRQVIIQPGERLDLIAYTRGYEAALATIAAMFGVDDAR